MAKCSEEVAASTVVLASSVIAMVEVATTDPALTPASDQTLRSATPVSVSAPLPPMTRSMLRLPLLSSMASALV